jgi:ribose-phosphate pyrophosphokinase
MQNKENVVLVANEASTELGQKLAERLWLPFTEMIRKRFSDGESYHAFPTSISGKDLVILGVTHNDASHQELLDLRRYLLECRINQRHTFSAIPMGIADRVP